jgi:hypothetical protein
MQHKIAVKFYTVEVKKVLELNKWLLINLEDDIGVTSRNGKKLYNKDFDLMYSCEYKLICTFLSTL